MKLKRWHIALTMIRYSFFSIAVLISWATIFVAPPASADPALAESVALNDDAKAQSHGFIKASLNMLDSVILMSMYLLCLVALAAATGCQTGCPPTASWWKKPNTA